jgi:hypothetical protein
MTQTEITTQITQIEAAIQQRNTALVNADPMIQRFAGQLEVLRTLVETPAPAEVSDAVAKKAKA